MVELTAPEQEPNPLGEVHTLVDGGDMDCGSGLLLLITRAMRRLTPGQVLGVRSAEPSVATDLPAWADLVGHEIVTETAESAEGPWWFAVRKVDQTARAATVFSQGERTPVGRRIWIYTNFNCNLACDYCCAESSPKVPARRFDPAIATTVLDEFVSQGGREVFFTGGEPFMHPQLGVLVEAAAGLDRTILTNGMVFAKGTRREILENLDRDVVLQISLDSATPELHDRQRGAGSWSRALDGIELARSLGFRVRVAATLYDEDPEEADALHRRLDESGIAASDRVIRPVAQEGFATTGMHVSLENLEPEPTLTADGAWWHPVAVTNPHLRIAGAPLPLAEVFGVVRDTLAVQDAAAQSGREVFRCA
ncbi:organic radical activating enzyme/TusA-related sulfurtransferase [Lipingzhangella halophila]|uniref:Organic radical activating enzyme/TusA-related sulfurtransferase n=1 Tax=Lipingzhangella halophila TaxID=1783352 RepID=A0A7W7W289_9ACTN|nr:radical SAM protein [Lipingzhangella halophila]MBB4930524.1 organic radical activating enzyme/TusA-related sulfurtransferase [Lipingzhangella halophila]